jgi:hypothetical protein
VIDWTSRQQEQDRKADVDPYTSRIMEQIGMDDVDIPTEKVRLRSRSIFSMSGEHRDQLPGARQ